MAGAEGASAPAAAEQVEGEQVAERRARAVSVAYPEGSPESDATGYVVAAVGVLAIAAAGRVRLVPAADALGWRPGEGHRPASPV